MHDKVSNLVEMTPCLFSVENARSFPSSTEQKDLVLRY